MSYVTAGGGAPSVLKKLEDVVPGWGYAHRNWESSKGKAIAALIVGIIVVGLFVIGLPTAIAVAAARANGDTFALQSLGAAGTKRIMRSDSYAWQGSPNGADSFLGRGVGPEFVEQPNYMLGQEDMLRTAINKYTRLKNSGVGVGSWNDFWAAYKAENSDDLDSSLYDFGDNRAAPVADQQWEKISKAQKAAGKSGFESSSLKKSMVGL